MVGGRGNATAGVVCRVKAVVRRVLARRTHAREVGGGPHMGPCELAVNTRGGPHRGPAEGARDPPSARRVPRRAPCTAGDRRRRAGRHEGVERTGLVAAAGAGPPGQTPDATAGVGSSHLSCFKRVRYLRMMVHEFECAQTTVRVHRVLIKAHPFLIIILRSSIFVSVPRLPDLVAL